MQLLLAGAHPVGLVVVANANVERFDFALLLLINGIKVALESVVRETFERTAIGTVERDVPHLLVEEAVGNARVVTQDGPRMVKGSGTNLREVTVVYQVGRSLEESAHLVLRQGLGEIGSQTRFNGLH